jgi:imidazoleglycerol-phosphate dehydratase
VNCREASITRDTTETKVKVHVSIDGSGQADINTGVRMFDHFLTQVARHGMFDLAVSSVGDDQHHVIEDVAICLGRAVNEALGDKGGLTRMSHALVPMDESLSMVAIDLSGRGAAYVAAPFAAAMIGDMESDMVRHFLLTFATEGRFTLHARVEAGINDHHKAESLFKALARALDGASRVDERRKGAVPSSKGVLER